MGFGSLNNAQREALREFVKDKQVHDLGAGDLTLSIELLTLGARLVVAIDKEAHLGASPPGIVTVKTYFEDYAFPIDVAFMSWPRNTMDFGLVRLVSGASVVAYLGKNTDGTACGYPLLWNHLRNRKVLAHVPDRTNTLIVYGEEEYGRNLIPEEFAALYQEEVWDYNKLQKVWA
jgi:hypothetical protein